MDFNLVKTFVLLYKTGSVTRTAEAMFVTQPAVSHSLRRLRRLFNDELFVRGEHGLAPTTSAQSAFPGLNQALETIEETVADIRGFDPATTTREFRLRLTDLGEMYLLPDILQTITTLAPQCTIDVQPLDFAAAAEDLRYGRADAVICTPDISATDLQRDPLLPSKYVGICTTSHPRVGPTPTLDEFLAERHILVDSSSGHDLTDQALSALGHRRNVAMRIPHFAALPELVARTRCLAVAPESVADAFMRTADVRTFDLPVDTAAVTVALYTYRRTVTSPAVEWLRNVVGRVRLS